MQSFPSRRTALLALFATILSACGSEPDAPPPSLAPTPQQPARAPADLYVVHKGTTTEPPQVSAFRIDPASGALTAAPVEGGALPLEDRVHEPVVDPTNRALYVATRHASPAGGGASGVRGLVYAFARDAATGGLRPLAGSPFGDERGGDFRSPVFEASGRFLYVGDPLAETIDAFSVDAATGALRPLPGGNVFPAANNVGGVAADPSGRALYATSSDGSVLAYGVEATGALSGPRDSLRAGLSTSAPAVHPGGRFVYAPNAGSHDVSGYAVDAATGRLAELPGSPFPAGLGPVALAFGPGGSVLYVLNGGEGTLAFFGVDAGTGALRRLGLTPVGAAAEGAGAIVVEPGGRFLYVAGFTSATLSTFAVDPATGALRLAGPPVPTLPRPAALAVTR